MTFSSQLSNLRPVDENNEVESDEIDNKKRRTCEVIAFKRTGLPEGNKIQAISDVLMHTFAEAEEIDKADLELIEEEFIKWRDKHPENKEAQLVDPKNRTKLVKISREILRAL